MQNGPGTAGTLGVHKICGGMFNTIDATATATTICSFTTPFRVGVRFDMDETIAANTVNAFDHIENEGRYFNIGFSAIFDDQISKYKWYPSIATFLSYVILYDIGNAG